MTAATPTSVLAKDDTYALNSGTGRRLVRIYVEISPAAANTTDLATYVPNLGAIAGMAFNGDSTSLLTSVGTMATFATTTVTWTTGGPQFAEFVGYYT